MSSITTTFSTGMISSNSGISPGRIKYAVTLLQIEPVQVFGKARLFSFEQSQQIIAKARELDRFKNVRHGVIQRVG